MLVDEDLAFAMDNRIPIFGECAELDHHCLFPAPVGTQLAQCLNLLTEEHWKLLSRLGSEQSCANHQLTSSKVINAMAAPAVHFFEGRTMCRSQREFDGNGCVHNGANSRRNLPSS